MSKKKSNFRKGFRKNKRVQHPAYLIDDCGKVYRYIGITHSSNTNGLKNEPLHKNPNPQDNRPAYVRPLVEEDLPNNFGRRYSNWQFSEKDKKKIAKIIEKSKKKPRK